MDAFVSECRVRSHELDALGHVNHAVYLNYFEQARYDALETGGLPVADLARKRGAGIFVVRIEVDYLKECLFGQVLRVRTWVETFRGSSMIVRQELHRVNDEPDDGPAAEARVTLVWIGESGRPARIPAEVREALSSPPAEGDS